MSNNDNDHKTRFQPKRPVPKETTVVTASQRPAADGAKPNLGDRPVPDDRTRFAPRAASEDKTRFVPRANLTPSKPDATSGRTVVKPSAKPGAGQATDQTRIYSPKASGSQRERQVSQSGPEGAAPYGTLKNRFALQEILGSGGMGVVYKATDRLKIEAQDKDPYVAIKVLNEEFKSHPEAFIALQRESRKTQRIAHPSIVTVYDFDRDGDMVFMTMEFLDGKPLDKLLAQYRSAGLPKEDRYRILEGICSALVRAHGENIIHSDLKPGNIFVTNRGVPKVFDFGIARAVAKVERTDDNLEDKTVFDAGDLGALTPAYASLEMLEGAPPDVRDDIYALGCIAYEIFAGEHPYNRVHADEANRQRLKLKRIPGMPTRQWRAIEACLAFKREDRVESVDAFWQAFSSRHKSKTKYVVAALAVVTSVATAAYQYRDEYFPQFSEQDARSEIEQQLRIEIRKESINRLIERRLFSKPWEDELWDEYQEVSDILPAADPWLGAVRTQIYQLYLDQIVHLISTEEYDRGQEVTANAYRYTDDESRLKELEGELSEAIENQRLERQRNQRAQAAAATQAREQQARREEQQRVDREFQAALQNVNNQLACRRQLDMEDFRIAVEQLRSLNLPEYRSQEARITQALAQCIETVGRTLPDRAEVFKQHALSIFPQNTRIATIVIEPRDPCSPSLAGQGASGARSSCQDAIAGGGQGPRLVVVPGVGASQPYAIGKYEVRVRDFSRFCQQTGTCDIDTNVEGELPITNISVNQAEAYLSWLSEATGYSYRLPTEREWMHAARANSERLDSNRNCRFDSRGIRRGGSVARVSVGMENGWGLVNHIGNAAEWAHGDGGVLYAMGGGYDTPMEACNFNTKVIHRGRPDGTTGFRVLREINNN